MLPVQDGSMSNPPPTCPTVTDSFRNGKLFLNGFLAVDFNVKVLKDGIRRMVNDFPDTLRSLRALR